MAPGGDSTARADTPSAPVTRGSENTYKPPHIPARILWPALGFPAVIAPGGAAKSDDASTCVTVLIISKQKSITSRRAAEHLRFVPWEQRHTRYLPPGTDHGFTEDEIEVRSNPSDGESLLENPGIPGVYKDEFALELYFGYHKVKVNKFATDFKNQFSAGLSQYVLDKYKEWEYYYLHEVRVSRAASSRLVPGQYNLFWVNANPNDTEKNRSDEMDLLIKRYATPTRKNLKTSLPQSFLLEEYEYDYDARHEPYNLGLSPQRRTEVLHPLFVQKDIPHLQIGHITDLHVDVRSDVYEDNLRRGRIVVELEDEHSFSLPVVLPKRKIDYVVPWGSIQFNNWNKAVTKLYSLAKSSDVLLLTGDLIDYGRGHLGLDAPEQLGNDAMYHVDRNWFLFYYILASGSSYTKPVYTILGNHDWRLNPYPPFAIAGAPDPRSLIDNYESFRKQADTYEEEEKRLDKILKEILKKAHGAGHEKAFNYLMDADGVLGLTLEDPELSVKQMWNLIKQTQTMNVEHFPTETKIDSVAWYLLLINPFLDYSFHLPGGYDILMLDWAKNEDVLFPVEMQGQETFFFPWEAKEAANAGPKAKSSLTGLQKKMVQSFVAKPGAAKVLGIHAPPIGPYPAWVNEVLYAGRVEHTTGHKELEGQKVEEDEKALAGRDHAEHYRTVYPDGTSKDWDMFYAVRPKDGLFGQTADYGSFQNDRDWFIQELRKDSANVRLVLSGHIHRNGLFIVDVPQGDPKHNALVGKMLIKMLTPATAAGASPPAVTRSPGGERGPLYVNSTSAGPRGHLYKLRDHKAETRVSSYVDSGYSVIVLSSDGTIRKIEYHTSSGLAKQF